MTLEIKNNNGSKLGIITFSPTNELVFSGEHDSLFKNFVLASLRKGITRMVDRVTEGGSRAIIIEPVAQNDPLFPLAFKEFLERNGYQVIEKHPNT